MTDRRDDEPQAPPLSPEFDGSAYAASSSESGGLYIESGATMADPGAIPLSDADDDEPQGEGPDTAETHRSGS